MKFFLYSSENICFEPWHYLSPMSPGIGGSETAQVEISWRLARRGHDVVSYAPIPDGLNPEWRGTTWRHSCEADFSEDGVWILSRCPEILDEFGPRRPEQPRWLVCQDVHYDMLTEERAEKIDIVFALCPTHGQYLRSRFPYLTDKLMLSGNGIRSDEIRALLKKTPQVKRNPKKMIWTSSADRGLDSMLMIFKRVREFVPDVELDCYYGWDNIDKIIAEESVPFRKNFKSRIEVLLDQPGVTWYGRVGQQQLYEAYLQAGLWVYPTEFFETSAISCMEAQALGTIPITNPIWGLGHNVIGGIMIEGHPEFDALTRARYVAEIIRLVSNPEQQESLRNEIALGSIMSHNWEHIVSQYEAILGGYRHRRFTGQYSFQIKHAQGRVLNIGCNDDAPGFGAIEGNVNVDICEVDPHAKTTNKLHLRADARQLPQELWGKFDTAILGDILEHMHDMDIVASINNARRATLRSGQVVVTFPIDERPALIADEYHPPNEEYISGVKAFHYRVLRKEHFEKLLTETGLKVQHYEFIDYGFSGGCGYVLT